MGVFLVCQRNFYRYMSEICLLIYAVYRRNKHNVSITVFNEE